MKPLSVYIHIPFCVQKCNYCDFLSAPATRETIAAYMKALKREITQEAELYREYSIKTIFFGGGTPSLADVADVEEILHILRTKYTLHAKAEITLEMNPATANLEKLKRLHEIGINRLSIGLQSANDKELKMLGRVHTYQDFLRTYQEARACGFQNINIDIMSGLPGQTFEDWEQTLQQVVNLQPEHISAYSLIIEEGTALYQNIDRYPPLASEEEDRKMYQETKRLLKEYGYERYEISNYAKQGYASRHNCVYWQRGDYVGFGLGASSLVDNVRWHNTSNREQYSSQCSKEEVQQLSQEECMEEYLFLGLRMMQGISIRDFEAQFRVDFMTKYGAIIQKWQQHGMLVLEGDRLYLSDAGIDISNQIFCDFLED